MVVRERQQFGFKILLAFILTLILFLLGIFVGFYLNQKKIETIENLEKDLLVSLQDIDTLYTQINKSELCKSKKYLDYINNELDKYAIKLTYLEESLGKNHEVVIRLKKPYNVLLIKHYLLMKEMEDCEKLVIILFFYSNRPEFIGLSENEGIILGHIREKYGVDKVKVYALDVDLGLRTVESIKEQYNITSYPSLIINDKTYGYLNKEELEKIVKELLTPNLS